jgi:hypothetical protein
MEKCPYCSDSNVCSVAVQIREQAKIGARNEPGGKWKRKRWEAFISRCQIAHNGCLHKEKLEQALAITPEFID